MRRRIRRGREQVGEDVSRLASEVQRLRRRVPLGMKTLPDDQGQAVIAYDAKIKARGIDFTSIDLGNDDGANRVRWYRETDGAMLAQVESYALPVLSAIDSELLLKSRAPDEVDSGAVTIVSSGAPEGGDDNRAAWLTSLWAPYATTPQSWVSVNTYDLDADDGSVHTRYLLDESGVSDFEQWASRRGWRKEYVGITYDAPNMAAGTGLNLTFSAPGDFAADTLLAGDLVEFIGASPRLPNYVIPNCDALANNDDEILMGLFNAHPTNAQDMGAKVFHFWVWNIP